jgi:hypothetical protein
MSDAPEHMNETPDPHGEYAAEQPVPPCRYCGGRHEVKHLDRTYTFKCPYVKSLEYYYSGDVKRVEFFSPNEMYLRTTYPNTTVWSVPTTNPYPQNS